MRLFFDKRRKQIIALSEIGLRRRGLVKAGRPDPASVILNHPVAVLERRPIEDDLGEWGGPDSPVDPIDDILLKAPRAVVFGKFGAGTRIMNGGNIVCPKDVIPVGVDDFDAIGRPRRGPKQAAPTAGSSRMYEKPCLGPCRAASKM